MRYKSRKDLRATLIRVVHSVGSGNAATRCQQQAPFTYRISIIYLNNPDSENRTYQSSNGIHTRYIILSAQENTKRLPTSQRSTHVQCRRKVTAG